MQFDLFYFTAHIHHVYLNVNTLLLPIFMQKLCGPFLIMIISFNDDNVKTSVFTK